MTRSSVLMWLELGAPVANALWLARLGIRFVLGAQDEFDRSREGHGDVKALNIMDAEPDREDVQLDARAASAVAAE